MELNPLSIITSDNITDDQFNPNSIDITKSSISEEGLKLYSVTSNKKIINRGKVMPGTSKSLQTKKINHLGLHIKKEREKKIHLIHLRMKLKKRQDKKIQILKMKILLL